MPRELAASALIPLLLVLTLAASPAWGADTPDGASSAVAAERAVVSPARHALTEKVQQLRAATLTRLQELEELRQGALDAEAELAVNRVISRTKLDFELGMLQLQLGQQKALGHEAETGELTPAIEALLRMRAELDDPNAAQPQARAHTDADGPR